MNETKTLRDEFAMAALAALISEPTPEYGLRVASALYDDSSMCLSLEEMFAYGAYRIADAMMKQREATE